MDKGLGLNAPAPADFQPHNDKTAAALGCKLRVDRDAFAPRSLGDGGCGGGGSMGVCRAIPANGANKGCVNRKLRAVPKGEALCQDFDGASIRGGRVKVHVGQGDVHVHASPGLAEDAGQGSFNWHGSGAQGPASFCRVSFRVCLGFL